MKRINFLRTDGQRSSISMSDRCKYILKYVADSKGISMQKLITSVYAEYEKSGEENFSLYLRDALMMNLYDEVVSDVR